MKKHLINLHLIRLILFSFFVIFISCGQLSVAPELIREWDSGSIKVTVRIKTE